MDTWLGMQHVHGKIGLHNLKCTLVGESSLKWSGLEQASDSTPCHDRDRTYPYSLYSDLSTPIPSHQNHSWAPNAKPEPSGSILSQLTSNTSPNPLTPLRLSNTLPNTPTPLHLVDAFPTQCSFDLFSSSCQVDSQHPHSFPTQRLSTFTLLRQVYSQCFIGLTTAVGQSPIVYLPCSMCPSPSFLALYIYVSLLSIVHSSVTSLAILHCMFLCHITRYPPFIFYVSSSVPCLCLPSFHPSLFHLLFHTFLMTHSRSFRSTQSLPHLHLYKYSSYKLW